MLTQEMSHASNGGRSAPDVFAYRLQEGLCLVKAIKLFVLHH